MSAYFEDLWELQHAIHRTELDYHGTLKSQQHNDRNAFAEHEERPQKYRDREMRKLAARYEIERWGERGWEPPVPQSGPQPVKVKRTQPVKIKSPYPEQLEEQDRASSVQRDVAKQDTRMLPSWARKVLAVADRIEFENETVKKHKIHPRRLDKNGQGHQQYIATLQHLESFQMGSCQQQSNDSRSDTRNGSQEDPQVLHQHQNEQFEEVRSPASSIGSAETIVPGVERQRNDEDDGAVDGLEVRTTRSGKSEATGGKPESKAALASNGITGKTSDHGTAERRVKQDTEVDRPVVVTDYRPDAVIHQEVPALAAPAERQELPPKAGQDPAQSEKLERKQQQKAATELKKKQRQEKRQEAKRQQMIEERRAEEERKKEDEGFWQWLREKQLANSNATVASLSKERYLREAKQKREREAREARRKIQREGRTTAA